MHCTASPLRKPIEPLHLPCASLGPIPPPHQAPASSSILNYEAYFIPLASPLPRSHSPLLQHDPNATPVFRSSGARRQLLAHFMSLRQVADYKDVQVADYTEHLIGSRSLTCVGSHSANGGVKAVQEVVPARHGRRVCADKPRIGAIHAQARRREINGDAGALHTARQTAGPTMRFSQPLEQGLHTSPQPSSSMLIWLWPTV